ncbi:hypothetical protein OX284_004865 [Flavobacterium sp. SUN046]|nr:hypothetical protein [Flavobacterium sp. SUN046]MEC4048752.1 hypothetical protein [Flavobacterium sp. SUN046]
MKNKKKILILILVVVLTCFSVVLYKQYRMVRDASELNKEQFIEKYYNK